MANSTMTVNSGGTLAGTGTVGNVTVANGGTFAPGSGAGARYGPNVIKGVGI